MLVGVGTARSGSASRWHARPGAGCGRPARRKDAASASIAPCAPSTLRRLRRAPASPRSPSRLALGFLRHARRRRLATPSCSRRTPPPGDPRSAPGRGHADLRRDAGPAAASIKVLDSGGTDHASGPSAAWTAAARGERSARRCSATASTRSAWRTVSAVDGHIRPPGRFVFGVGRRRRPARPIGGGRRNEPERLAARRDRPLAPVPRPRCAPRRGLRRARHRPGPRRRPAPARRRGWVLTALGTIGVIAVQWAGGGAPIETLAGTSVGISALARILSLAPHRRRARRARRSASGSRGRRGLAARRDRRRARVRRRRRSPGTRRRGERPLVQVATQWLHGLAAACGSADCRAARRPAIDCRPRSDCRLHGTSRPGRPCARGRGR